MHKFDAADKKTIIKDELVRLSKALGKTPSMRDWKLHQSINVGIDQVTYLFGKWSSALLESGLTPNAAGQPPRPTRIPDSDLVNEFLRVCNEIKSIPGMHHFASLSNYTWRPYQDRWGSWANAKRAILTAHKDRVFFTIPDSFDESENPSERKMLGVDLPLLFQPTNEFETIALFCLLTKELGYKIKAIKSSFPDCVLEKDGREILTEFEFLSSNYVQHGHPVSSEYFCICWRKDSDIPGLHIFSLEEYIRSKNGGGA